MVNRTYAKEWLVFAMKNFDTAKLLYGVNHYEDIIGVELQQALEKLLKSVFAYQNIKIPKDHDLVKLYFTLDEFMKLEDSEITNLRIATDYYKEDRYPNPNYTLPPREEIKDVLDFTEKLFDTVCEVLEIKQEELI